MEKRIPQFLSAVCLLAAILVPECVSRADVAPPLKPPGSNIAPEQQTMVQMISENVLVWIRNDDAGGYFASIGAEFLMENQGEAGESMQVRFPMESIDGLGDGRGQRPLVRNFTVKRNDEWLTVQTVQEPYQSGGPEIAWSTFPVEFPPHEKIFIRVFYDTDLETVYGYGEEYSTTDYILETGSGWYGPIGDAVITLRLPYEAGMTTVRQTDPRPLTFVGHEARYFFHDLEPGSGDDIEFLFVNPSVWLEILDLERRTGENPKDVALVVQLADLYLSLSAMCPPRAGPLRNEQTQYLAETIVAQGLFYSPGNPDLLAEQALTEYHRFVCLENQPWNSPQVQNIYRELDLVFSLDPDNPIAKAVKEQLDFLKSSLPVSSATLLPPSETPAATPAVTEAPETSTPRVIPACNWKEEPASESGFGATAVLLGILLFLGGGVLGAFLYRLWNRSRTARPG